MKNMTLMYKVLIALNSASFVFVAICSYHPPFG